MRFLPGIFRVAASLGVLLAVTVAPARAEFIRGIYTNGAATFDTIVSLGFNMVVSGPAWETELVRARELNLKVIPSWYGDDTAAHELMRSLDTDPIVMAWYPFDEPEIYGYTPDTVRAKIARLREYSPTKPVYLTVFTPSRYAAYLSSADIFGITPYPIGSRPEDIHMDIVGRYTRRARALMRDRPLLVCIPAFFQRPWQYRAPEPFEMHNIVYQALTGSPEGVIFFIWQVQGLDGVIWNLGQQPEMLAEMGVINRELIDLDAVLTAGTPAVGADVQPATIYHRVIAWGGDTYWILANPYEDPVTATLDLPGAASSPRLLHGGRAELVASDGGTVRVRLGALGYAAIRITTRLTR